jgi:hypothetical protein
LTPNTIRTYRMTVATRWYDQVAGKARIYEGHFKAARTGSIHTVRRNLADKGVPFFQRTIWKRYRKWIPKSSIRVGFEREQPALKASPEVQIEFRDLEFRGKQYSAYARPSSRMRYVRRRRKHVRRR